MLVHYNFLCHIQGSIITNRTFWVKQKADVKALLFLAQMRFLY